MTLTPNRLTFSPYDLPFTPPKNHIIERSSTPGISKFHNTPSKIPRLYNPPRIQNPQSQQETTTSDYTICRQTDIISPQLTIKCNYVNQTKKLKKQENNMYDDLSKGNIPPPPASLEKSSVCSNTCNHFASDCHCCGGGGGDGSCTIQFQSGKNQADLIRQFCERELESSRDKDIKKHLEAIRPYVDREIKSEQQQQDFDDDEVFKNWNVKFFQQCANQQERNLCSGGKNYLDEENSTGEQEYEEFQITANGDYIEFYPVTDCRIQQGCDKKIESTNSIRQSQSFNNEGYESLKTITHAFLKNQLSPQRKKSLKKSKNKSNQCSNQSPITQCQVPQLPDIKHKLMQCQKQQQIAINAVSSPQRIKTARFPSVDMNAMLLIPGMKDIVRNKEKVQELYSQTENDALDREIQQINEQKGTIFEQSQQDQELLHQINSQKLMNDSFMNCDYLFSETQGVVTGTHFSKQNLSGDDNQNLLTNCIRDTTISTDACKRPIVGEYLQKIDGNSTERKISSPSNNRFKQSPKSDRFTVTLSKVAPKAISNSLLQPILMGKKGCNGLNLSSSKYNSQKKQISGVKAKNVNDSTNFSFEDSMQIRQNIGSIIHEKPQQLKLSPRQQQLSGEQRRSPKFKLELPVISAKHFDQNKYNLPRQRPNCCKTPPPSHHYTNFHQQRSVTPKGTSKFTLSHRQSNPITPKSKNINKSFFPKESKNELSKSVNVTPKNKHQKTFQFKTPIGNYNSKKSNDEEKKQRKPRPRDIMQIKIQNQPIVKKDNKLLGRGKSPRRETPNITPRYQQKSPIEKQQAITQNNPLKSQNRSKSPLRKSQISTKISNPRVTSYTNTACTTPRKIQPRKPVEQEKKKFISKATLKRLNEKKKAQEIKQAKCVGNKSQRIENFPQASKPSNRYNEINPILTTVSSNYSSNNPFEIPTTSNQQIAAGKIQRFFRKWNEKRIKLLKLSQDFSINTSQQGFQTPQNKDKMRASITSSSISYFIPNDVKLNVSNATTISNNNNQTIKKKKEHQFLPPQSVVSSYEKQNSQSPKHTKQQNHKSFLTSNLMQSCVASFYATQMTIWKETLKMYQQKGKQ